jgi:hypothetical protein
MSSPTRYVKGDWKTVCDACGQRFLASDLRKRWDGLMVCERDFELRHPQDYVRAKIDIQAVPFSRTESTDYQYVPFHFTPGIYEVIGMWDSWREHHTTKNGITDTLTLVEGVSAKQRQPVNSNTLAFTESTIATYYTRSLNPINKSAINSSSLG